MCSGITRSIVLSGEFYAQRLQTLIYLHLFTDCFMKISLQSSEQIQVWGFGHINVVIINHKQWFFFLS